MAKQLSKSLNLLLKFRFFVIEFSFLSKIPDKNSSGMTDKKCKVLFFLMKE
jgi:hypothetical protein